MGKFVVCLPLLYYSLSKGDVVFHERLMRGPWCRALERRDERASESAYFFAFFAFFATDPDEFSLSRLSISARMRATSPSVMILENVSLK